MTPEERGKEIADALGWIYHKLPYSSVFEDWDNERRGWPEALAAFRARNAALREAAEVARQYMAKKDLPGYGKATGSAIEALIKDEQEPKP